MRVPLALALAALWAAGAAASTKVNDSSSADEPRVLAGPGGELIVFYDDAWLWWTLARFDVHGNRVFGPVKVETGGKYPGTNDVAWSGDRIGWAYSISVGVSDNEIWFHTNWPDGTLASAPVYVSPSSAGLEPCCADIAWVEGEFLVGYISEMGANGGKSLAMRRLAANGTLASPEMSVMAVGPPGFINDIKVGRVDDVLFAAWYRWIDWTSPTRVEGSWFDLAGNRLTGPTTYTQSSTGTTIEIAGLASLAGRVSLFTLERDEQTSVPVRAIEQRHIGTDDSVLLGPQQIAEYWLPTNGYFPTLAPDGYGIGWGHRSATDQAGQLYLRRVAPDGTAPSTSMRVSDVPSGRTHGTSSVAYQERAYGVAWADNREVFQQWDVFFDTAPGYELLPVGAGPSPSAAPQVKLCQPETGAPAVTIAPYAAGGYGANVGAGEIDGDDADELLTGPGPGPIYGPQVRAFDWRGAPIPKVNFYAYGTLRYGARVQSGNLDADVYREVLTSPGPGVVFGPHVRGFTFDGAQLQAMAKVSFFAYQTLAYGASATGGDVEKDGYAEILTGPGPSGAFGSQLRGFDYDGTTVRSLARINRIVFPGSTHGLHVAARDTDWDDMAEIACARGPGPGNDTTVAVYDDDGVGLVEKPGSRFEAFAGSLWGAQVSFCQWWGKDFHREILVSLGPAPASTSEVVARDDATAGFGWQASFDPYPGQSHGSTHGSLFVGY